MQENKEVQASQETNEVPQRAEHKEGEAQMPVFAAAAKGPLARPESRRDQINMALRQLAAGKL